MEVMPVWRAMITRGVRAMGVVLMSLSMMRGRLVVVVMLGGGGEAEGVGVVGVTGGGRATILSSKIKRRHSILDGGFRGY